MEVWSEVARLAGKNKNWTHNKYKPAVMLNN